MVLNVHMCYEAKNTSKLWKKVVVSYPQIVIILQILRRTTAEGEPEKMMSNDHHRNPMNGKGMTSLEPTCKRNVP